MWILICGRETGSPATSLLGRVVGRDRLEVLAYVQEEDVQRISTGDSAIFIADAGVGPVLDLRVRSVDQDASRTLRRRRCLRRLAA